MEKCSNTKKILSWEKQIFLHFSTPLPGVLLPTTYKKPSLSDPCGKLGT